jgi:hypothetical protein
MNTRIKVVPRHLARQDQILVDVLDQIGGFLFGQFAIQHQRGEYLRCPVMEVKVPQALLISMSKYCSEEAVRDCR